MPLRAVLGSHHKITLINERDYFQFTPSNPWIAVGKRARKAITFELRPYLEKKEINFIDKRVTIVKAEKNNERDYFQFTPSNPWIAVGKRA